MSAIDPAPPLAGRLNRECFCLSLDQDQLCQALRREAADPDFCARFLSQRPHLFSPSPVFLPQAALEMMQAIVTAIEAAARLPAYQEAVLAWAPAIARHDFGPQGAFMGYDFHLAEEGPKLIEVNTNAGGGFLNALLAGAQRACCAEVEAAMRRTGNTAPLAAFLDMFLREWALQGRSGRPTRVAIVDDAPEAQYLYPEFLLARQMFLKHGIDAVIADAAALTYEGGRLRADGQTVDLVYNRLVDFALERPEHAALRAAYLDQAAVVTPNPRHHALFADKRNLTLLSDPARLAGWGLALEHLAPLAGVPRTVAVTPANAETLWAARKKLFFKPEGGHGSKAVYRGDKLARGVWADIARGGYVAQDFAPPGERMVEIDGVRQVRKVDVRLYVYDGRILMTAARLYQGQATNFRTPGGGFAPVFAV